MAQGVGLAFSEVESAQDYIRSRGLIHLYLFCRSTSASDKLRPTRRRRDASSLKVDSLSRHRMSSEEPKPESTEISDLCQAAKRLGLEGGK